jgi:deazaflavin-dependent oxidoreductase (nitroreductase family)
MPRACCKHPAWFYNVLAHPVVTLEVAGKTFSATAAIAQGAEREDLFIRQITVHPRYGGYQEKMDRTIPVVIFTRDD